MDYTIEQLGPLQVVGMGLDCPGFDASGIGPLWDKLVAREGELPASPRGWGVSRIYDGGFYYVGGREVPADTPVPDGMEALQIPEGRYVRVAFHDEPAQLGPTYGRIFQELIPAAGLTPAPSTLCLEEYGGDWHDEANGKFKMNLYVQIAD